MNSQTSKSLTEGSLYRHLCTLALPLILGNILQQFYNTIDAFVIGRFAGTGEFAAIGIAGTVMNLFLFALVGVCTGFSSLPASFICFTVIGNCCFKKKDCQLVPDRLRETLHFGSVTALHQSGLYIGKMLVQGAVNTGGTDLIAAYTAATRVEGFANSFGDSGSAAISHCA